MEAYLRPPFLLKKSCDREDEKMNVPQHIAIILDGNGRWAKSKGMPRNYGHAQGAKNVEKICEEAWRMPLDTIVLICCRALPMLYILKRVP